MVRSRKLPPPLHVADALCPTCKQPAQVTMNHDRHLWLVCTSDAGCGHTIKSRGEQRDAMIRAKVTIWRVDAVTADRHFKRSWWHRPLLGRETS